MILTIETEKEMEEERQEIPSTSMMATPGHVNKLHFSIGLTFKISQLKRRRFNNA